MNLDTAGCLLQPANGNGGLAHQPGAGWGPLLCGRGASLGNRTHTQKWPTLQTGGLPCPVPSCPSSKQPTHLNLKVPAKRPESGGWPTLLILPSPLPPPSFPALPACLTPGFCHSVLPSKVLTRPLSCSASVLLSPTPTPSYQLWAVSWATSQGPTSLQLPSAYT